MFLSFIVLSIIKSHKMSVLAVAIVHATPSKHASTEVVSASIDTNVQESLIEETLKEMGEGTWLS